MTIGERIKQRRIELEMSQDELGKKVGYKSRSSIQKIESARNLPITKVELMANALECTPAYLMGWEEQARAFSEEMARQTKPIKGFFETHTVDYGRIFEALLEQYGEKDVERAFRFTRAFLSATPERQKIALEILQQSHQGDS